MVPETADPRLVETFASDVATLPSEVLTFASDVEAAVAVELVVESDELIWLSEVDWIVFVEMADDRLELI